MHAAGERADRLASPAMLWAGIALAPAAWFTQLAVGYSLVSMACEHNATWTLHVTSAIALLLAVVGLATAWRSYRTAPAARDGSEPDYEPSRARVSAEVRTRRVRFMALSGILLSAFFAFTVALAWLPSFLVESCPPL